MANNNNKFVSRENAKTLWGYMIDLLTGKQNKLTFDDTPTQNSDNPVKSGGIYTALSGKGTYSKPQNGIPKTDLESAVQTSLGLADSALQSETDPTVPSWAKASSKPSYNSDEISDTNRTHKFATDEQLNQISMNQTNILYAIKTGAKNIIYLPNGVYSPSSKTKFTVVDGAVTCETTASYTDAIYLPDFVMPAGTYSVYNFANNTGFQVRLYDANNTRIDDNPFTLNSDTTVRVALYSLGAASSGTLTPMICLKSVYDQDSSYQLPALQNSDLTYLEAEDRAALAEEIDAGAKNKLPIGCLTTTYQTVTITNNNDGTITFNGTKSANTDGVAIADLTSVAVVENWLTVSRFKIPEGQYVVPDSGNQYLIYHVFAHNGSTSVSLGSTQSAGGDLTFTYNNSSTYPYICIRVVMLAGASFSNVKIKPMLCTKSAFNVSKTFVPYSTVSKVVAKVEKSFTSTADTLASTGCTYTTQSNKTYRITAWASYSSNPIAVAIVNSVNGAVFGYAEHPSGLTNARVTATAIVIGADTIEIKAKYSGSSTCKVGMIIEEIVGV